MLQGLLHRIPLNLIIKIIKCKEIILAGLQLNQLHVLSIHYFYQILQVVDLDEVIVHLEEVLLH